MCLKLCTVFQSGPQLWVGVFKGTQRDLVLNCVIIVLLQVLEEISCYADNTDVKELRRILTQPHFMVS